MPFVFTEHGVAKLAIIEESKIIWSQVGTEKIKSLGKYFYKINTID